MNEPDSIPDGAIRAGLPPEPHIQRAEAEVPAAQSTTWEKARTPFLLLFAALTAYTGYEGGTYFERQKQLARDGKRLDEHGEMVRDVVKHKEGDVRWRIGALDAIGKMADSEAALQEDPELLRQVSAIKQSAKRSSEILQKKL